LKKIGSTRSSEIGCDDINALIKEKRTTIECIYGKNTFKNAIYPSTVFSIFHMDQLAKIRWHRCKERLKFGGVAEFESGRMNTNKDMALQSRKIL